MKRKLLLLYFCVVACLVVVSCSSSKKTQSEITSDEWETVVQTIVPDTFVLPEVPETITDSDERAKFVVLHYWDRFDFGNRALVHRPEITEQAFVDYIHILNYVPLETTERSLEKMLKQAEKDSVVYANFASLFDKYLHDPNSPFRNEEYYIPVLRSLVKSPVLTAEEKSRYDFQLNLALKNRVGSVANDFTYTSVSGKSATLHSLQSEFVLLMFTDPGCPTCEAVTQRLVHSREINEALSRNTPTRTMLTILTVYPDGNLEEWKSHLNELPANWLNTYDSEMQITQNTLYDIKAYPTLYLLNKEKRVILKDTSVETIESFFSVSS